MTIFLVKTTRDNDDLEEYLFGNDKGIELSPSDLELARNDWNAFKLAYDLPDCGVDKLLKKLEGLK